MNIRDFRALARSLVREFGMLNKQSNGSRFSPLQIHLMIEVSEQPLGVTELAARLCIDKASASRALRSLVAAGVIETVDHPDDKRHNLHRLSKRAAKRWPASRATPTVLCRRRWRSWTTMSWRVPPRR